jgi:hypothetical protein
MNVVINAVTHVEQRSGIIDAYCADSQKAGHAQKERERQGALMERREDYRLVKPAPGDSFDERYCCFTIDGVRFRIDPLRFLNDDVFDARKHIRGRCTARTAKQCNARVSGQRAQRGTGEEHVAVVVLTRCQ